MQLGQMATHDAALWQLFPRLSVPHSKKRINCRWGSEGSKISHAREAACIIGVTMSDENADSYHFIAECPKCRQSRGVSCSRTQVATSDLIKVYAIQCDHAWTLTLEDSKKLRTKSEALG